jgi:hypothetical protein
MKKLILILLILLYEILIIKCRNNKYIKNHEILLNHMRNHKKSIWNEYNDTFDKGIITCAGNFMIPRVISIIYV